MLHKTAQWFFGLTQVQSYKKRINSRKPVEESCRSSVEGYKNGMEIFN